MMSLVPSCHNGRTIEKKTKQTKRHTVDLVKEICKQLLYSIAIIQQTNDVLWQRIAFQLYKTMLSQENLHIK